MKTGPFRSTIALRTTGLSLRGAQPVSATSPAAGSRRRRSLPPLFRLSVEPAGPGLLRVARLRTGSPRQPARLERGAAEAPRRGAWQPGSRGPHLPRRRSMHIMPVSGVPPTHLRPCNGIRRCGVLSYDTGRCACSAGALQVQHHVCVLPDARYRQDWGNEAACGRLRSLHQALPRTTRPWACAARRWSP